MLLPGGQLMLEPFEILYCGFGVTSYGEQLQEGWLVTRCSGCKSYPAVGVVNGGLGWRSDAQTSRDSTWGEPGNTELSEWAPRPQGWASPSPASLLRPRRSPREVTVSASPDSCKTALFKILPVCHLGLQVNAHHTTVECSGDSQRVSVVSCGPCNCPRDPPHLLASVWPRRPSPTSWATEALLQGDCRIT